MKLGFWRFLFLFIFSFAVLSRSEAGEQHIAILDFRGIGIDKNNLPILAAQSRAAAAAVLNSEGYIVITRENMLQILEDMGKDISCIDGLCEVEIGRNIGADYIVVGDVIKIEGQYVLTLQLYSTGSGALLSSMDVQDSSVLGLKKKTLAVSKELFRAGLNIGSSNKNSALASSKGSVGSRTSSREKSKKINNDNDDLRWGLYELLYPHCDKYLKIQAQTISCNQAYLSTRCSCRGGSISSIRCEGKTICEEREYEGLISDFKNASVVSGNDDFCVADDDLDVCLVVTFDEIEAGMIAGILRKLNR